MNMGRQCENMIKKKRFRAYFFTLASLLMTKTSASVFEIVHNFDDISFKTLWHFFEDFCTGHHNKYELKKLRIISAIKLFK